MPPPMTPSVAAVATVGRQRAEIGRSDRPVGRDVILELLHELAPTGYLASTLPAPAGSSRRPSEFAAMVEALTPGLPFLGNHSVQRYLWEYGTEEQRETWLDDLLGGRAIAAIAITESDAGADVRSTATYAEPVAGGWELHGEKTWVTHGPIADLFVVTARTGRSLTRFLVPATADGLRCDGFPTTGLRYLHFGDLVLDHVRVGHDAVLGEVDGGLAGTLTAFPVARGIAAVQACAIADQAIHVGIELLGDIDRFGAGLLQKQSVHIALADCWARVQAARALALEAMATPATEATEGRRRSAAAKFLATDTAVEVCGVVIRLLGSHGLRAGCTVDRHLRDAQMLAVADASATINQLIVARGLLENSAF